MNKYLNTQKDGNLRRVITGSVRRGNDQGVTPLNSWEVNDRNIFLPHSIFRHEVIFITSAMGQILTQCRRHTNEQNRTAR